MLGESSGIVQIDGIDHSTEVHIRDGQWLFILKANREDDPQIIEIVNWFCLRRAQVFLNAGCFGKQ